MARRRDKGAERRVARHRIERLLERARDEALGPDRDLAGRHAALARRIAMRYQVPLTPAQRMQVCRRCGAYRVPGRTSRTRITHHRIATTCLQCGHVARRPLVARP